ncbi:MAG: ATP synthase F1 subunit epsilon [Fusobacteriaceae bacterium]
MATFNLKVVTSRKVLLDMEAEFVMLRTVEGDMGILANHSPFVAELTMGEMKIRDADGKEDFYFVSGGFLEISKKNVMTILADEAMHSADIDIERERKEAELAEAKLKKSQEDKELLLTQKALEEALLKVRLAERHL